MNRTGSKTLFAKMTGVTPGGVSSPVRAFTPHPLFFAKGRGCMIEDIDGNEYIDLCMAYGPLILGHSDDDVSRAITDQAKKGTVYGAPSEQEMKLISMLIDRIPCADMVRLNNSGTEATMHAIRLARGYTSRNGIAKIKGGFHGSHDAVLVSSDSGITMPSSKGIPQDSVEHTYETEFNDIAALEGLLERSDIAAVILEPVMGNTGVIVPEKDYLEKVRKLTSEHGTVLIFDEVITGSRLSSGGAQGSYGIVPDICTMGKIIGGGLPIGAVAGKREIMEMLAPAGKVYQAGTFSGNPLTAAAGAAALSKMNDAAYSKLNRTSQKLTEAMSDALADRNVRGCVQSAGSMFQVFFGIDGAKNASEAGLADRELFKRMFAYFLDRGVYLPPSPFEVNFLSVSHGCDAVSKISEIFDGFLGTVIE